MVSIREIQHYNYCPHRWGLLYINGDWDENASVVMANLMHERVHSGKILSNKNNIVTVSSVSVYNDNPTINLYGVLDCIEFIQSNQGVFVEKLNNKYKLNIVEYKPTKPKTSEFSIADALQVFAQKLCVDYVFKTNATCEIYYADVKRRYKLPFDSEFEYYYKFVTDIIGKIEYYYTTDQIPQIEKSQKCSGCSMINICFPKVKQKLTVKNQIFDEKENDHA